MFICRRLGEGKEKEGGKDHLQASFEQTMLDVATDATLTLEFALFLPILFLKKAHLLLRSHRSTWPCPSLSVGVM